jgi:hypothetical protein
MTPEQIDRSEDRIDAVLAANGYCKVQVFLYGDPLPKTGEYERINSTTIVLHNGLSDQLIIDIAGIIAIGVTK